jgi:CheY-like chemotaxis protein
MQANSAGAALKLLEQQIPDLILSDIGMPEMNGYELMQVVRQRFSQRGIPIPAIALTAYASELDQQRALAAGFQHHLAKPVYADALVQAIAQLMQRS